MSIRIDSFQRSISAVSALLFTVAIVVFSTPVVPLA
jgi:hypothetical protein